MDMLNDEELAKKSFKAIEDFIEFKKSADELVERVFTEKEILPMFKAAVKEAFESFLNIDPGIVAEYLAKFIDFNLKKTSGATVSLGDENLEILIN
mmetsp:Transcript_18371/g.13238  ORF Transcript_18371/g.13238 Transcript_18371/m.13238 type:complete len:96 (-) Transcript_18371:1160-1447(-)|eukprot:CAMPEP_0116873184 /NCGR_PEP_ID=MMETSP0463-20121206/4190_1 /TAXON_ID=181622 /ORGANISM="Strombidinopsis sp, Strain SopsisLIS2011" /LENGTH=95 /DNA_ID=CAMNT_0004514663 /DNA_START=1057 /DNA_END=1344 /DNA_ORIENTATION=+